MSGLVETDLGRFPEDWPFKPIGEVFDTQLGKMLSQRARGGDDPQPYLRNKNVQWGYIDLTDVLTMDFSEREQAKFKLQPGDLLVCEGGVVGRAALWNGAITECYYQKALHRLRPTNGSITNEFMLYWLRFAFEIQNLYGVSGASSTIAHLPAAQLRALDVPIPPLPEQKKISHILSTVQRAIEAQERIIQTTTELKKALMHKLFTEGLRNEPQKQTEIGLVPESWEVVKLGTLFEKQPQNGIYKHKRDYGSGTQILRIDDFSNDGDVVIKAGNRVTLARSEIDTYRLDPGDIVINRVNSLSHLGKTALIGGISDEMVFESNMMRFSVNESQVLKEYLFKYLNSPMTKKQIIGTAKRAVAQSSINQGDVKSIIVPRPSLEEQGEIVTALGSTEAKIAHSTNKAAVIRDLFRTLLHELMTAKIRVHELEITACA